MKKFVLKLFLALLSLGAFNSPVYASETKANEEVSEYLTGINDTILNFDKDSQQPSKEEIQKMLDFAMKAPSGLNQQPYWITVITDTSIQEELALTPEVKPTDSTIMFVYSYPSEEEASEVDMGISYGYLHIMAEALGYGAHIYCQPARMLADEEKAGDYVPQGHTPYAFVLVGVPDQADVTSQATPGVREANYSYLGE